MNNPPSTTTLHPIHPVFQFEAKHALRFLDNFLRTRTRGVNGGGGLFGAVPVYATGRDLKADFATLAGPIGPYRFAWDGDTLECISDSTRRSVRQGTFEVDFGDEPCDFLSDIWNCPLPEARACVRTAVSRLAEAVAGIQPATDGGIAARFAQLVRHHHLAARERDLLLLGLCVSDGLLEYDLDRSGRSRFPSRLEEAAAYLALAPDAILPLVRADSRLRTYGLLDNDFTPSRATSEYLEGSAAGPLCTSFAMTDREIEAAADLFEDDSQ